MDFRRLGARIDVQQVEFAELVTRVGADVREVPDGVALVLRGGRPHQWQVAPLLPAMAAHRLRVLLGFLDTLPELGGTAGWWAFVCVLDGWREGTPFAKRTQLAEQVWRPGDPARPGVAPRLTADGRPLIAFGRHHGDASAVLVPEMHYLQSHRYARTRFELSWQRRPWSWKSRSAIYAGGDHGDPTSFFSHSGEDAHPRARLRRLAALTGEPLDVRIGEHIARREQLRHQLIVDLDGHARTWDAWFWKMRGGSTVLAQDSVWVSFFSEQFEPWVHFVPLANDLSDLETQLRWCWGNERECRRIASRAGARARQVYSARAVAERAAAHLAPLLR